MKTLALLVATLVAAVAVGLISKKRQGRFVEKKNFHPLVTAAEVGQELGSVATVLQFSSAFCTPCRATRQVLENVVPSFPGMTHIEIDAESHLELVRRLHVNQTPTTIFLNSKGQEIGRAVCEPKKSQVVAVLEKI